MSFLSIKIVRKQEQRELDLNQEIKMFNDKNIVRSIRKNVI